MEKRLFGYFTAAIKQLALVAFITMNVAPAIAQYAYSTPSYMYAPSPSAIVSNPTLIFEAQAPLLFYSPTLTNYSQLPAGTMFASPMMRDPFHYAVNASAFDYAAMLNSAYQTPTAVGPMVPASLINPVMFADGTTFPADSDFYIPPAEFTYNRIRAIGARSDYNDEDINRLMSNILESDDRVSPRSYSPARSELEADSEDDDDDRESEREQYRQRINEQNRNRLERYQATPPPAPRTYSQTQQDQRGHSHGPQGRIEDLPDENFRITGPTCNCRRSNGRACVFTSEFGVDRGTHRHQGVDVGTAIGTPIVAVADGVISEQYVDARGYGKTMLVRHTNRHMVRYAHLSRWIVRPGERVSRGQIIGYTGNTGRSTAPHLHFEVCRLRGNETRCNQANSVNPRNYMSRNANTQLNQTCEALRTGNADAAASSTQSPAESRRSGSRTSR